MKKYIAVISIAIILCSCSSINYNHITGFYVGSSRDSLRHSTISLNYDSTFIYTFQSSGSWMPNDTDTITGHWHIRGNYLILEMGQSNTYSLSENNEKQKCTTLHLYDKMSKQPICFAEIFQINKAQRKIYYSDIEGFVEIEGAFDHILCAFLQIDSKIIDNRYLYHDICVYLDTKPHSYLTIKRIYRINYRKKRLVHHNNKSHINYFQRVDNHS